MSSLPVDSHQADLLRDLSGALKMRDWSGTDPIRKREFEGSVYFTSGIFNVMMSLLPPRVIKMAEVVGFHGDRVRARAGLFRCK